MKKDKIYHAIAGALIAFISFFLGYHLLYATIGSCAISSFMLVLTAGFGKEMWDAFNGGRFDFIDLAYTLVSGGLVSLAMYFIF